MGHLHLGRDVGLRSAVGEGSIPKRFSRLCRSVPGEQQGICRYRPRDWHTAAQHRDTECPGALSHGRGCPPACGSWGRAVTPQPLPPLPSPPHLLRDSRPPVLQLFQKHADACGLGFSPVEFICGPLASIRLLARRLALTLGFDRARDAAHLIHRCVCACVRVRERGGHPALAQEAAPPPRDARV